MAERIISRDNPDWRIDIESYLTTGERFSQEDIGRVILMAGFVEIRDVDAGQEPFLYTSGNYGPGYIDIKGSIGQDEVFKFLVRQLALKIVDSGFQFDFIAANVTGGMTPGFWLKEQLQDLQTRRIPYTYVRAAQKETGFKELITGIRANPYINEGDIALSVEELINYGDTTTASHIVLNAAGFTSDAVATMLHYENPRAIRLFQKNKIEVIPLITLSEILAVSVEDKFFTPEAVDGFRNYLQDPVGWQSSRGFTPVTN